MDAPRRSAWPIGVLILAFACARAPAPAGGTSYVEVGYGRAGYDFRDPGAPGLTRDLIDVEVGILREVGAGGALRFGSSLSLMPAPDRALGGSYSFFALDMLKLDYSPREAFYGRVGLGLIRAFAPVNEITVGLSLTLGYDLGPLSIGLKGRAARFEADFEPHGTPPDTKYNAFYGGLVLGRAFGGD